MRRANVFALAMGLVGQLLAGPAVVSAWAQPSGTVTCSSAPGQRERCETDTSSGVSLSKSVGEAACSLGRTWGFDAKGIWVGDGCTGEFSVAGYSRPITSCASVAGAREQCDVDTSSGVVLVRQTSTASCLMGRTWGYDDEGIWVSDGCSGDFAPRIARC